MPRGGGLWPKGGLSHRREEEAVEGRRGVCSTGGGGNGKLGTTSEGFSTRQQSNVNCRV